MRSIATATHPDGFLLLVLYHSVHQSQICMTYSQQSASCSIITITNGHLEALLSGTARVYRSPHLPQPSIHLNHCDRHLSEQLRIGRVLTHVLGGQLLFLETRNPSNSKGQWKFVVLLQSQLYALYYALIGRNCNTTGIFRVL